MRFRSVLSILGLAALAACHRAPRDRSAEPRGGEVPTALTALSAPADSAYAAVRARLTAHGYRIDEADDSGRRLVVRGPTDSVQVEVRIVPRGDSSAISASPLRGGGLAAGLRAVLTVLHATTTEAAPADSAKPGSGGLLRRPRVAP